MFKMIEVRVSTHEQTKRQSKVAKIPMRDYIQKIIDLYKDETILDLEPSSLSQLIKQANTAGMFPTAYLDLILKHFESDAKGIKNG